MKSKLTLAALFIMLSTILLFFQKRTEEPSKPDKISGAYEALNFLSMQRI